MFKHIQQFKVMSSEQKKIGKIQHEPYISLHMLRHIYVHTHTHTQFIYILGSTCSRAICEERKEAERREQKCGISLISFRSRYTIENAWRECFTQQRNGLT